MTARRQASTTSLSKYAHINSPDLTNRSLDFCNAFWGVGDSGVDVLFARMRGASRTIEELKTFWKDRSAIEEEYARKMAKLAKMSLGRDEIGELRNALDTVRLETDKQASFHLQLSQQIHSDLEAQTNTFHLKQIHHKKNYQAIIEKQFKAKQALESAVNKSREKYESDCMRINSFTAQSLLTQGKDLDKLLAKLKTVKQTVDVNERDYSNASKALVELTQKWEVEWKSFCDNCQDLEEERAAFMKDNMWAYANAVSAVCVSDDESCEKLRLALEQLMPEKDLENFVRDYSTGNAIPEPPSFVDYSKPDAVTTSGMRSSTRPAQFTRVSHRSGPLWPPPPPTAEDDSSPGAAGIGANGGNRPPDVPSDVQNSRSTLSRSPAGTTVNGTAYSGNSSASVHSPSRSMGTVYSSPEGTHPELEETYIQVGSTAYKVDPSKGSQPQRNPSRNQSPMQGKMDPLEEHMEKLKQAAASSSSSGRRNSIWNKTENAGAPARKTTMESALSPPQASGSNTTRPSSSAGATALTHHYNRSAESVVGTYPVSASRPTSPQPPTAHHMVPPSRTPVSPVMPNVPVEDIVDRYGSSLPGEHKANSASVGRRDTLDIRAHGGGGSSSSNADADSGQRLGRRPSQNPHVHAGVGAHGRSRSVSPAPEFANPMRGGGGGSVGNAGRGPGPNSSRIGVALDPEGRVVRDTMAENARNPPRSPGAMQQVPIPQQGARQPQTAYAVTPGRPVGYGAGVPYQNTPPVPQPGSVPSSSGAYYPPAGNAPPPPNATSYSNRGGPHHGNPPSHMNYANAYPNQPAPSSWGGGASPTPPPAQSQQPPNHYTPTGQTTEDGRGILFYVKALYDYQATIDEEFDFQAGDIIAVTATPEDGWWSGELLDEARRQPGRHVFPSNFVCLF